LMETIENTKHNTRMTLVLALNYSAKWEILEAVKSIGKQIEEQKITPDQVDENIFENALSTKGIPDPELLIRTSGETRLSNFLLWQIAYSEFYFTPVFWPEFGKDDFYNAIIDFQKRERRFGKTGDQISS